MSFDRNNIELFHVNDYEDDGIPLWGSGYTTFDEDIQNMIYRRLSSGNLMKSSFFPKSMIPSLVRGKQRET